ncbi:MULTISPECIES: BlaI/MecI/CopY family transcriptional regulator [Streptomyces]|uniref:BlaI/MecI/CopY family transcriptional regulator n=1 Tax=Streptomyces abikoensis TaxID=97398 RepID=A0ABW7TBJ3_9ACTN|nr:BlaI/MecI/CopY family transcriptional regulator [Streptomyces luteoverticillatus]
MSSQAAAELRSRYVEQVASELEENRRRQEELAKKIELLQQEEALLSDILNLAERYEGFADASRLPEQAQGEPAVAKAKRRSAAGATTRRSTPSGTASAGTRTKSDAKGKPGRPLLGDSLMDLLTGHDEPRSAKELRDELLEKDPSRNPTPQVVRNTLESLVAKGRVQRHKQQRAVMYTLVKPADDADAG